VWPPPPPPAADDDPNKIYDGDQCAYYLIGSMERPSILTCLSHRFYGDGKYSGDGGKDLEKLWKAFIWKEIRCCPGRFISRNRKIRSLAQRAILVEAGCCHAMAENAKKNIKGDGRMRTEIILDPVGNTSY